MAFWGNSFVFNDIPCDDYDLMLYDVGSTAQGSGNFASGVSIIEETLPSRYKLTSTESSSIRSWNLQWSLV